MRVLLLLVIGVVLVNCDFQTDLAIWSQDLLPGYMIETSIIDGRTCHCKVPCTTTTSTSTTSTSPKTTTTSTSTSSTTTTTPTTSSTTTTTSTTSSTTTTTPTSTTSSTTTTTPASTTFSTPTSSTTTTPTTTTDGTSCGYCDVHYDINLNDYSAGNFLLTWKSPNYPGEYPDDCDCLLTFELNTAGLVVVYMDEDSSIYSNSNCAYDRLEIYGDIENPETVCDSTTDSYESQMMSLTGDSLFFVANFVSEPGDNNAQDVGFKMYINVTLWGFGGRSQDDHFDTRRESKTGKGFHIPREKTQYMDYEELIGEEYDDQYDVPDITPRLSSKRDQFMKDKDDVQKILEMENE